jgi:hypothetical protein
MKIVKSVKSIKWHHNGISGQSFYVILFIGIDFEGKERNMVATLFPGDSDDLDNLEAHTDRCAVFDADLLAAGDIGSANQWFGDVWERALRPLIVNHFQSQQ